MRGIVALLANRRSAISLVAAITLALVSWRSARADAAGLSPYAGSPAPVPGTMQAADFDNGGEGVAYHDSTPGNAGEAYRDADVDIQASSEQGYNVGWTAAGEWMNYTVNVASTGSFTVHLRVASVGGGTLHVWPSVAIPDTGGWQAWTTVNVPVSLHAGLQQLTVFFDTGGVNLGFVTIDSGSSEGSTGSLTPYTGTPAAIPGTIDAANFDNGGEGIAFHDTTPGNAGGAARSTDVDIEPSSEGGYDVGWIAPAEWLNYSVNAGTAGSYVVDLRVASPVDGTAVHIGFNGPSNVWTAASIPNTGGWQNWTTVSVPVTLGAGPQVLTVYFDTGGVNLRSIAVTGGSGSGGSESSVPSFSHVYLIVMENHEISDVIGNGSAPYINQLAAQYGLATDYAGITHPSLPNYMAMTGGNTYFSDDCVGCTVDAPNIADQVETAGLTWKAYMEDMPGPCGTSDTALYATRHNPFIHYDDVVSNASRCQSHVVPLTDWYADAAAGRVPRFAWITPNLCSDMHDCDVAAGDAWLANIVPQIMSTPDFGSSVLFITWDEGTTNAGGGGLIPLLVVSPMVPSGFRSSAPADHFSVLRTIEDAWGLPSLMNAADARDLSEFFQR